MNAQILYKLKWFHGARREFNTLNETFGPYNIEILFCEELNPLKNAINLYAFLLDFSSSYSQIGDIGPTAVCSPVSRGIKNV